MIPAATYTAKQIADALGMTRQNIAWHLRCIPAAGVQHVNGNEAAAWTLPQLPAAMRARLETESARQRCRTVDDFLAMPRRQYQPAIPLDKISDPNIQAATKLRAALLPWLYRQHDTRLTSAEMDAAGVADYQRVFGNTITARYWRELFTRTIRRDNNFEEWNRLEIYLPDKPTPRTAPDDVVSEALALDLAEVQDYLAACGNPHNPTETERAGVWTLALEKYSALVHAGTPEKKARRHVREFLFARAKFLAPTRNALRMAFDRKLEKHQAAPEDPKAIRDGRADNGPEFNLAEQDRDLLIACAVYGTFGRRGEIAAAWRGLIQGKQIPVKDGRQIIKKGFSAELLQRYTAAPARKSYVPANVMASIAPEVETLSVMHQGPRAFDAARGYVTRSYDSISSLQCISGDDFTLNTYFYVPDGKGWFELTRGQVILFIDFRSLRILGWALEPRKSYSSLTIRSLCTHVFGEFGVPQVLYFERGMWKSATLLKGKTNPFTFTEISQGLREFGIQFKHAIRPRTKVVERIGGMFQAIAEAEPGYCGRDERRDAPESLRRQMAEVEARKNHPSKYFYSLDQWNQRLAQLVQQYNTEPQQGHILAGLSPEQAFETHIDHANPPLQFSAALRYLLSHDKRTARVTLNGITIQIGKVKYNYKGPETAHLVGRDVLAWFDPENPETIVITNSDRTNPICVSRSQNPNALESIIDPAAGTLATELARVEDQASYMKTLYNVVKAKFPLPQRQMLATAQAVELGEQFTAQKARVAETKKRDRQQQGQKQSLYRKTGVFAEGAVEAARARRLQDFMTDETTSEGKAGQ